MRYNPLGQSDLHVSELCLGTMTYGEQNTQAEAHEQLDYAISQGINFIDTAEMYPIAPRSETQGHTERAIGSWLKHQPRDQLIIATKVTGPGRGFGWIRGGPRITRDQVHQAIDASLKRLQTDFIDLYQIHWPDRNVPMFGQTSYHPADERETTAIIEQLEIFAGLIKAGKIRHLGVSNETPWGLGQFLNIAEHSGLPRVISIQNAYNLINRVFENGLSEYCARDRIGLLAYSPLAYGTLSAKYLNPGHDGRVRRFSAFAQRYLKPGINEAVAAYAHLADKHGLSPASLALAFVRSRWFVASSIIGATSMAQLHENIASKDIELSPELLAELDAIHLRHPNPAP